MFRSSPSTAKHKSAWSPLAIPLFRWVWVATLVSYIGSEARNSAGPWLMELLTKGRADQAVLVPRVMTMATLPICLLSIPAGALADLLDRRVFLVFTQLWMVVLSALIAVLVVSGAIAPWSLLLLTFVLSIGIALSGPSFQAIVPELVPKEDLPLSIALNSVALNIARAVGPALFMLIVVGVFAGSQPGVGYSFLFTAVSFVGVAGVLWMWKRPPQRAAVAGEQVWSAIIAGLRYTLYSPAMRAILIRVVAFIVCALAIMSQLPVISEHQLGVHALGFGILNACFGCGAILGVVMMHELQRRFSIDAVVNGSTAVFGLAMVALSRVHQAWLADVLMFLLGVAWVIVPTNFNVATQTSVPAWVKGRAISMYLTFLWGSFAVGAAVWGHVTHAVSANPRMPNTQPSLLIAGLAMLAGLLLVRRFPLTLNKGLDLGPAYAGTPPDVLRLKPAEHGPVRVAMHYQVPSHRSPGLQEVLADLRLARLRSGARRWELKNGQVTEGMAAFTELITFASWDEYVRYYSRTTKWDVMLEGLAREYHVRTDPPQMVATETRPPLSSGNPERTAPERLAVMSSPRSLWLQERIAQGLDRAIDEMFAAYDRLKETGSHKH